MVSYFLDHLRRILVRTWRSRVVRLSVAGTLIVIVLANIIDRNLVLQPARSAGARLEIAFSALATLPERIMLRWQTCDRDWRLYCLRPKDRQDEILALAAYDLSNEDWLRRPIGSELSFRLDETRNRWLSATGGDRDCYAYPARNLMDRAPAPAPPAASAPPPPGADFDFSELLSVLHPPPEFWQRLSLAGRDFRNAEDDRRTLAATPAPFDEAALRQAAANLKTLAGGLLAAPTPSDAAGLTRRLTELYDDFDTSLARLGAIHAELRARSPSEDAATAVIGAHIADPDDAFRATASAAALHDFLFRASIADKSARFAGIDAVLLLARNAAKVRAKLAIAEADLQMLELYRRLHILIGRDAAAWAPAPSLAIVEVPLAERALDDPAVAEAVTVAFEDRQNPAPRLPEVRLCFPHGQAPWGFVPREGFFGTVAFAVAAVASMAIGAVMGPIDAVAALFADSRFAGSLVIGSWLLLVAVSLVRLWRRATSHAEVLVGVPEILVLSAVWTFLLIIVGRWLFDQLVAAVGLTVGVLAWTPIYIATLVYPRMEKAVGLTLVGWAHVRRALPRRPRPG